MKLLLSLLIALTLSADSKMFVMLVSVHHTFEEVRDNRNDLNLGLGYEYTTTSGFGVQTGAFYNSFYEPSVFAGVHYEYGLLPELFLSASLSGATGYKEAKGYDIIPLALVGVQYKSMRIVTNTIFAAFTVEQFSVTNLQFVYNFKD